MLGKTEGRRKKGWQRIKGWMTSPTQRAWIWVNSGSWWCTGRPGMLQSMGSQRVRHDWATELTQVLRWLLKKKKRSQHCWWGCREIEILIKTVAAAAKSLQSCQTSCNPIDGSPPGTPIPGILQARTLEWVAISFSNAWKWKVKVKSLSHVWLFATPWTAAYQAPPSMGFSRQEHWSGVPLPFPGDRLNPGIKLGSPASQADSLGSPE